MSMAGSEKDSGNWMIRRTTSDWYDTPEQRDSPPSDSLRSGQLGAIAELCWRTSPEPSRGGRVPLWLRVTCHSASSMVLRRGSGAFGGIGGMLYRRWRAWAGSGGAGEGTRGGPGSSSCPKSSEDDMGKSRHEAVEDRSQSSLEGTDTACRASSVGDRPATRRAYWGGGGGVEEGVKKSSGAGGGLQARRGRKGGR